MWLRYAPPRSEPAGDPAAIASLPAPVKPRLRGVSHQYAFFVSIACGVGLILAASGGRARVAASIYAVAVSALLGTSALYHRVTWRPRARRWMRRLDHSMIFVLIAGTYTPVALLALKGSLATTILIVLWAGALGGVVFKLAVDRRAEVAAGARSTSRSAWSPRPCSASCPRRSAGWAWRAWRPAACCTCRRRRLRQRAPEPLARVFGYHEIFHALVIAAAGLHYAVIAFAVLPRG